MTDHVKALWRYPVKSMGGEELKAVDISVRGILGDRAYAVVDKATNRAAAVRTWASGMMLHSARFESEPRMDAPPPPVRIAEPDGHTFSSSNADAEPRLSATFGRELSLMTKAPSGLLVEFPPGTLGGKYAELTEGPLAGRAPAGTFFDAACIHLIAQATIARLQSVYPQGKIDARRFRANVIVETPDDAFVENRWVGRRLAIGDEVILTVATPCPRCVNVTMAQPDLPREGGFLRTIAQQNAVDLGDAGNLPCAGAYADVIQGGHVKTGDVIRWLD
jgi:uncharacterized protein YcbX